MPDTFTPEQISQILEEFFKVVGTRQYIGARYVPIFGRKDEDSIEWDNTGEYEPLTIVLYQGNSYTSRQFVPVGVEITNEDFWAITGNYNAQVELYRRETAAAREVANNALTAANNAQDDIDTLLPKADFSAENTVKDYVDAVQNDIDTLLPKADFSAENTVKDYIDAIQNDIDTLLPKADFSTELTVKDYIDNVSNTKAVAFDTISDMQASTDLKVGDIVHVNGGSVVNDGKSTWFVIKDSNPYPSVDVVTCGSLFAQQITTNALIGSAMRNDDVSFDWIADCAASWMRVASQIRYDGAANLFFDDTHQIQGKWSMTCSIFAMAMAFGITYENSKYNGLSANITNPLAYKDDYLLSLLNDSRGFYSDDILPYMIRKGYAFLPTEDFENVQTGDILFYAYGIEEPDVNFMDVDHTAVFAFKNNDLIMSQWEVGSDDGPVQTTNYIDQAYEKCVMVVRLPYQTGNEGLIYNIFSDTNVNKQNVSQFRMPITKDIVSGKWYTFVAKCSNLPYGVYPGLYSGGYSHRLTTYHSTFDKNPYDNVYIMPFIADINVSDKALYPSFVKRSEVTQDPIGTFEWVVLVEGFCPTLLKEIEYSNLITDVSNSVSTTHTKRNDFKCYKCGKVVDLTIDIQLTSNVSAYATIATLPAFLQPIAQQFYGNFDITVSGNIRTIQQLSENAYVQMSFVYLAKE